MEVFYANTGLNRLLAWAKMSYVLLSCVPITFSGSTPEMPIALVLASSAHSVLRQLGIYVQNALKNVEVTIPVLKERRSKSRKEIKTSSHIMEKEVSTVEVHCHVDSFTIKRCLFVAEAVATSLFFFPMHNF